MLFRTIQEVLELTKQTKQIFLSSKLDEKTVTLEVLFFELASERCRATRTV